MEVSSHNKMAPEQETNARAKRAREKIEECTLSRLMWEWMGHHKMRERKIGKWALAGETGGGKS